MSELARRYRAFVSYSQKDKAQARRLHQALERYRVPKGVEAAGADAKSRKLGRFFRDDDEMGASTDLGAALQGAIADSDNLIVICSPNSAQSKWVNEEILHFKRIGRADKIFAVIVAGAPNSEDEHECFPPALRYPVEPLAIDFRKDGWPRLIARLAAGLIDVPFDNLWKRERRRRRTNALLLAGASLGLSVVLAIGGWATMQADARAQALAALEASRSQTLSEDQRLRFAMLAYAASGSEDVQIAAERRVSDLIADTQLQGWQFVRTFAIGAAPSTIVFSDRVIVTDGGETPASWDAMTGARLSRSMAQSEEARALLARGATIELREDADGAPQIWTRNPQRELTHFGRHILSGGRLEGLEFAALSPDRSRLVTISAAPGAQGVFVDVWDVATAERIATLIGHQSAVIHAVFDAAGDRIATSSYDGTARIWEVSTGREIGRVAGHEGGVSAAAFSADGARLVTVSIEGEARIWRERPREIIAFGRRDGPIEEASFGRNDALVVTASANGAYIWDIARGGDASLVLAREASVQTASFASGGRYLVTGSSDNVARIWDAQSGRELAALRGHEVQLTTVIFDPQGARVATASHDGSARVWDGLSGRQLAEMRGHEGRVFAAAFSPDGAQLVTASQDFTARIWDAGSGRQLVLLAGHQGAIATARFSPDGATIVTASYDNSARLWSAASGEQIAELRVGDHPVTSAVFGPDGTRVLTASDDNILRVWDVGTGRELLSLIGHQAPISAATFSSDGTLIASGSEDMTARVWDAVSGRELAVLRGHDAKITTATLSSNGALLLTASWDGSARLWNIAQLRDSEWRRTSELPFLLHAICDAATGRLAGQSAMTQEDIAAAPPLRRHLGRDVCDS